MGVESERVVCGVWVGRRILGRLDNGQRVHVEAIRRRGQNVSTRVDSVERGDERTSGQDDFEHHPQPR